MVPTILAMLPRGTLVWLVVVWVATVGALAHSTLRKHPHPIIRTEIAAVVLNGLILLVTALVVDKGLKR